MAAHIPGLDFEKPIAELEARISELRSTARAGSLDIDAEVSIAGTKAIVPVISGTAWITGTHQHTLDPTDPYPQGYRLSDTWPA